MAELESAKKIRGDFAAKEGENVSLTVTIGDGQFGVIKVMVDDVFVASSQEKLHVSLGEAGSLRGRKIKVLSVVNDVNPITNRTVMTWVLTTAAANKSFQHSHVVKSDWGVVVYDAEFKVA